MKVAISEITDKMTNVLKAHGYRDDDIPFIIEMYLGGELRGHTSHGLANFPSFAAKKKPDLSSVEVLKATNACFYIDAKSNPGVLVGKQAADEAMKRAKKEITSTAIIKNMNSWLRPGAVAQYIADQGFLSVVVNAPGRAAVSPPGGFEPVTGTNPIAYGVPTEEGPLVVDMATSKRAWGEVRLANKYGTNLPEDTFYNNQGQATLDSKEAYSVKPFGDYKGFALNFLIEIMCRSFIGMDVMINSSAANNFGGKLPDHGAFILVIDPRQTVGLDVFQSAVSEYVQRIKETKPLNGQQVRIPGDKASAEQAPKLQSGVIDIPDELWKEIKSL